MSTVASTAGRSSDADSPIMRQAAQLGELLLQQQRRMLTVESCTGGGIGQVVTAVGGSSDWFDRAYVTYSDRAKTDMVGVPAELIQTHGAVSEAVALAMLQGAMQRCDADCGVAVTGIAGPAGGTADKPVGSVCFAWQVRAAGQSGGTAAGADANRADSVVLTARFDGDRHAVRQATIHQALAGLIKLLTRQV